VSDTPRPPGWWTPPQPEAESVPHPREDLHEALRKLRDAGILVEFLRARLDEDQQRGEEVPALVSKLRNEIDRTLYRRTGGTRDLADAVMPLISTTLELHTARVLADVEAKRRIVATFTELDAHPNRLTYAFMQQQWVALRAVIAGLALPYASHPDYQEEWRP
jgi:hypothetical protein